MTSYRFLPWVRRGLASGLTNPDTLGPGMPGRASIDITMRVGDRSPRRPDIVLHGPGDVVGFDRAQIVRTEPADHSAGFAATNLAVVELASPELPWMLTPGAADGRGRLRPWLCLIVVADGAGPAPRPGGTAPLPSITVPTVELPDLAESWAWAHAQVLLEDGDDPAEVLAEGDDRCCSRLVCPQRLVPDTAYHAYLVPTFEAGRLAGLGLATSADPGELQPAWSLAVGSASEITLPVYHHWSFRTGVGGDVESLLRRLHHRPLPPGVGVRRVVVDLGDDVAGGGVLDLGGVLRPVGSAPPLDAVPTELAGDLRRLLNRRHPGHSEDGPPVVAPPVYGAWQAAHDTVPAPGEPPRWLGELNVNPRYRAAAGLGALVVQDRQNQLMAIAWAQVGEIEEANQLLREAQLAREAGRRIRQHRLTRMAPGELLALTHQAHPKVLLGDQTARQRIRRSRLPIAATSPAFRRVARPRGRLGRRIGLDGDDLAATLVEGLATGALTTAGPAPVPRPLANPDHVLSPDELHEAVAGNPGVTEPGPRAPGFAAVVDADRAHLDEIFGITAPEPPPAPLEDLQSTLLDQLDPDRSVADGTLDRLGQRRQARSRATDPLGPVMAAPSFPEPTYEALVELAADALLPGLDRVPADTVALLQPDPRFVEAFLVGLNHEMSRELLWREYPTDQRGTFFTRFWPSPTRDPAPTGERSPLIHQWNADQDLGGNHPDAGADRQLALLLRGDLLRRYPATQVYAVEATPGPGGVPTLGRRQLPPRFRAALGLDVTVVVFDLTEEEARAGGTGGHGWFFIIAQGSADPQFGLSAPSAGDTLPLDSWAALTWDHVAADGSAPPRHVPIAGPLAGIVLDGLEWGHNSAHMAAITLRRPVQVAVHATDLLPRVAGS